MSVLGEIEAITVALVSMRGSASPAADGSIYFEQHIIYQVESRS